MKIKGFAFHFCFQSASSQIAVQEKVISLYAQFMFILHKRVYSSGASHTTEQTQMQFFVASQWNCP